MRRVRQSGDVTLILSRMWIVEAFVMYIVVDLSTENAKMI
jgi:hypothetical protein